MRGAVGAILLGAAACRGGDFSPSPDASVDGSSAYDGCFYLCQTDQPVVVDVSCVAAAVADASVTGVCGPFVCFTVDGGKPFVDCKQVYMRPSAAGTCSVALSFDDGFQFDASVAFTVAQPGSACCPATLAPSPSWLVVQAPDAGCLVDGGAD